MKFLLDTNVFLWLATEPGRVPAATASMLRDSTNEVSVSAVTAWEIAIKYAIGRLPLPEPPARYVRNRVRAGQLALLDITLEHIGHTADLPLHHRDPFDRLLIAQAQQESLTIVTGDPAFLQYDVRVIAV